MYSLSLKVPFRLSNTHRLSFTRLDATYITESHFVCL
jgi:hypothetical protein